MAIKRYKPITPGTRFKTVIAAPELTGDKPYKPLLREQSRKGGRNFSGKITVRHIGGGNRQKYRVIDFKRNKDNIPAKVATVEYDPNRTAFIALLNYADGEKRYILAPLGLQKGDTVISGENADIKAGNCLPLANIPVGQMARTAGAAAQLMAKEGKYATLRLPSGEMRMVLQRCKATIGQVGNLDHELVSLGKAGRKRHMGVKPTVRGVVMNPCDHPHGGGEGKTGPGGHPKTPWGKPALGYKTRKKGKASDKLIVRRRKK